jgi:hypothetical protein
MKFISFTALALVLLFAVAFTMPQPTDPHTTASYSEAMYVTDVSDPQRLAGLAHNVFVGRVEGFQGTHYPDELPESLFTVEVIDNLKGELRGQVTVNQLGGVCQGVENKNVEDTLHLVNNDPLLVEGQLYLFATLPDKAGRWHTAIPVFGDVLIPNAAEQAKLTATYRTAVENQIQYDLADYQ